MLRTSFVLFVLLCTLILISTFARNFHSNEKSKGPHRDCDPTSDDKEIPVVQNQRNQERDLRVSAQFRSRYCLETSSSRIVLLSSRSNQPPCGGSLSLCVIPLGTKSCHFGTCQTNDRIRLLVPWRHQPLKQTIFARNWQQNPP